MTLARHTPYSDPPSPQTLILGLGEFDDSLLGMGKSEGKPKVLLGADCFYR